MIVHKNNKYEALKLRAKGKSYREIVSILDIPKSTLSYWLRSIKMTKEQTDALAEKQRQGRIKGAENRRNWRIEKEKSILEESAKEVSILSIRDLWLLGTVAYWCEGSKQKSNNVSARVIFTNSDPFLIKLFIKWIQEVCHVSRDRLIYNIYIHETGDLEKSLNYWSKILEVDKHDFAKTVFKKHSLSTNRKYSNNSYFGLMKVTVRNSTDLNRQIKGWVNGISSFLD